jgi:hypothetical protein
VAERMKKGLTTTQIAVMAILLLAPLAIMLGKWSALPTSAFLAQWCSLEFLPQEAHAGAGHILFVPLGAVLVVLVRLTLGIRVLGPFRSVLLAVAFQVTGILWGVIFLAVIMGIILLLRPAVRFLRMAYFGRISTILSIVAAAMVLGLFFSAWVGEKSLLHVVSMPIVVLCLMGEGLARTLRREGRISALWRGSMTALLAVAIAALTLVPGFLGLLLAYPELLVFQVGLIVVIARLLDFRLLAWINPKPVKRRRKKKARKAVQPSP